MQQLNNQKIKAILDACVLFTPLAQVASSLGYEKNQAATLANQAIIQLTDINLLRVLGVASENSHTPNIKWYTAFDLSQEIGSTTRDVNEKLMKLGFQEAPYGEWMPTKLGQIFCRILDTGKKHGNNTPIKQIQWDYHILNLLKTA